MPLPDALPDRRIYELLKTVDLENLTFSDFQKVAQTIYAEQGAEDELRRIVLLNLARLSVAGEWSGLTSAGSASGIGALPSVAASTSPPEDAINLHADPLFGQVFAYSPENVNFANFGNPCYFPFYSPKSGNISEMTMRVTTADTTGCDVIFGIYQSSDGLPSSLLGTATFDGSSTGNKTQTSFSSTITLTAGDLYFFGVVRDSGSSDGKLRACNGNYLRFLQIGQSISSTGNTGYRSATATSLPASVTVTDCTSNYRPYLSLVVA